MACALSQHVFLRISHTRCSLYFPGISRNFFIEMTVDDNHLPVDTPLVSDGHDGARMLRNASFELIIEDQNEEPTMEDRIERVETDIAGIQLDVREFRKDMEVANESLRDLRDDVARVDGKVDALGGRVDQLDDKVDVLGGKVEKLDGEIDALGGRVDKLNGKVDALGGRVDKLDDKVDVLSGKVEKLDGKVDALGIRVEKLDGKVDALADSKADKADVRRLEDKMDAGFAEMRTSMNEMRRNMDEMRTSIADVGKAVVGIQSVLKTVAWGAGLLVTIAGTGFTVAKAAGWL